MFVLARLLLLERVRKSRLNYGWAGYASAGLALPILGWVALDFAVRYLKAADFGLFEALLVALWTAWALFAAFTGKDLSWRINRERMLAFPSPGFLQFYMLGFILGFLSCPLLLLLLVSQFGNFLKAGLGVGSVLAALMGYLLFVASIRLIASLAHVAVYRVRYLPRYLKAIVLTAMALIPASALSSIFGFEIRALHPGHLFGLVLAGKQYLHPLASLVLWTGLLGLADYRVQRDLTYSGTSGPLAPCNRLMRRCGILLFHPRWPGPLFRVGILGWLRSRSALLLFVWGGIYSVLWTFYSGPDDVVYFFLFIWMNLLFHSYLRGNLLGTDRGGVWLYYMFPCPIDRSLSSKSLSLSLLQGCMILSLLVAGFLRAGAYFAIADWSRILSYAISGITIGEISGFFFSIKYPDPLDRKSQFDGGTTIGALIVPLFQILFLSLFILISASARQLPMPGPYWGTLLAVPLLLFAARFVVLKTWVCSTMLEEREAIQKKLIG